MSEEEQVTTTQRDGDTAKAETAKPASSEKQEHQSTATSVDWKGRFAGLQKSYAKLQSQLAAAKEAREQAIAEYEERIASLSANLDETKSEADEWKTTASTLEEDASRAKRELDVVRAINNPQHPELKVLAPLWSQGLIAVGDKEGDELTEFLQRYAETLGRTLGDKVESSIAGSVPKSTGNTKTGATITADEAYQKLMQLEPGSKEYNDYFALYQELNGDKNA